MEDKPFSLGILVGRFQALHTGHEQMIHTALALCDRVGIFVGSSQESGTANNPFSYETREGLLRMPPGGSMCCKMYSSGIIAPPICWFPARRPGGSAGSMASAVCGYPSCISPKPSRSPLLRCGAFSWLMTGKAGSAIPIPCSGGSMPVFGRSFFLPGIGRRPPFEFCARKTGGHSFRSNERKYI